MTVRESEVKVEWVPLVTLKAYDNNAKKHDNANVDAIANSIEEFGFRNPILAWHNEDGAAEIVAGHGRAAAAKKLRLDTVPVVFVDDLSDAQRRMLTHADNQTTLMTGWDYAELESELDTLSSAFDVEMFGFEKQIQETNEGEPEEVENNPLAKVCILAVFEAKDAAKAMELKQLAESFGADVTAGGASNV